MKKLSAMLLVLTMLASLVLSGYSFADRNPVRAEEEVAEEEVAEEETAEEEESTAYTCGGFTFLMPESDYELTESYDGAYVFQSGDTALLQFMVSPLEDEELTQEDIRAEVEGALSLFFDAYQPEGKIRRSYFDLNGISAVRTSFAATVEDVEGEMDLDITILVSDTDFAMFAASKMADEVDADYIRFLDEIIFSITSGEVEEEIEEEAEAPEGAIAMKMGETTEIEGIAQITPQSFEIVPGDLLPSNTDGYYSYYEDVADETYLVIKGDIKNLCGETIDVQFGTNNKFVVNGTYSYTGTLTAEEDDHSSFYGYDIKPLKTSTFVYYVSVPDELVEMFEFGELEITFNDMINYVSSYDEPAYRLYLKVTE